MVQALLSLEVDGVVCEFSKILLLFWKKKSGATLTRVIFALYNHGRASNGMNQARPQRYLLQCKCDDS